MYDLLIIGGGPAGTAAAITAARKHAQVLLLERGRFPRHKVCGEFVSAESVGLLSSLLAGFPAATCILEHAPRIHKGRLFVDHTVLEAPIEPAAVSIPRFELDAALWQAARQAGAHARQQVTVQAVSGRGPFLVSTPEEEFEARAVVNASGRWSNLSAGQGAGSTTRWIGLKAHFAEPAPAPSVDLYFFPGGYCGVQPLSIGENSRESRVNVCAMVRADVANSLPAVFSCHPELSRRSRSWQQLIEVVATSPLDFRAPRPDRDGVLLAGDAAAFVDPFVGDGISLGLRSGAMAAESLQGVFAGEQLVEEAVRSYRTNYTQRFTGVFRTSSRIRRLFGLPWPLRASLMYLFGNAPALTRYLVRRTR